MEYEEANVPPSFKVKVKSVSHSVVFDSVNPGAVSCQAPLSMELSRQEYWSGQPFPSPGDLPDPGIECESPTLQTDSLQSEPLGKPQVSCKILIVLHPPHVSLPPNIHFFLHYYHSASLPPARRQGIITLTYQLGNKLCIFHDILKFFL